MFKFTKPGQTRKRGAAKTRVAPAAVESTADVPFAVRVPVYAASVGLFAVYAWGYLNSGLGGLAWGLVGVTAMSEALKPQLGELAARALDAKDRTAQAIVATGALVCVLLGAAGGVVAIHVAEAPRARYEAAAQALSDARSKVADAQAKVDSVPTCAPEMPASRCERMVIENAPILAERREGVAAAKADEENAKRDLAETPVIGPGLPHIELWHKALFIGGAEFLMFGVPFAALRLRRKSSDRPSDDKECVRGLGGLPTQRQEIVKVNDGGWSSRRAKYGPTGRKPMHGGRASIAPA